MTEAVQGTRCGMGTADLVVASNRIPIQRVELADGTVQWRTSPGGLVSALEPVVRRAGGAWVGWSGSAAGRSTTVDADGMRLVAMPLAAEDVEAYYEGFSNTTLWPLYHDLIAPPRFRHDWWDAYVRVNAHFAQTIASEAAPNGVVWIHDYHLQLVPAQLRRLRPDLRIGFFLHIPFPDVDLFAQLPWGRQVADGLLGSDVIGLQRRSDVAKLLRVCRWAGAPAVHGEIVEAGDARPVRIRAFPISLDFAALDQLARRQDVEARACEIRSALGNPQTVLLGVDRMDYTKGIPQRLQAFEELLAEGRFRTGTHVLVQVTGPSRERVQHYGQLRDSVEAIVGRINGRHAVLGQEAVYYLLRAYPPEEMAALYRAADVMLVTALRDGMNLVAKEYVSCRYDDTGALVLSEFTGAADELTDAFLVNPHDIEAMKDTMERAANVPAQEARRRMRSMRAQVRTNDVDRWAASFLEALRRPNHT